jgi:hypothetical protein
VVATEDGTEVRDWRQFVYFSWSPTWPTDDYDDRRRDVYESPADKLKTAIIKFGEVVSARRTTTLRAAVHLLSRMPWRNFRGWRSIYAIQLLSSSPTCLKLSG